MSHNPHTIDPAGDVLLHLHSDSSALEIILRVSSKVLCLASPVFKSMLGPDSPFQEALAVRNGTDTPAAITLRDDDPDTLLMLLQAAHLPAHLLPRSLPIAAFYNLAIVCDKYDMARVLLPWAIIWMSTTADPDDPLWLVIAWVFRDTAKFKASTGRLMLCAKPDEDNNLVVEERRLSVPLVPASVIDAIGAGRTLVIATLYRVAHAELEKYTTAAADGRILCKERVVSDPALQAQLGTMRSACDRLVAGSLLLLMARLGFYPPREEDTTRGAEEIVEIMIDDRTDYSSMMAVKGYMNHSSCDWRLQLGRAFIGEMFRKRGLVLADYMAEEAIFYPAEG